MGTYPIINSEPSSSVPMPFIRFQRHLPERKGMGMDGHVIAARTEARPRLAPCPDVRVSGMGMESLVVGTLRGNEGRVARFLKELFADLKPRMEVSFV